MINLSSAKGLVVLGKNVIMAHRPELLFGASIVATVGGAVLAAKGGYEARGIIDEEIRRRDAANEQEPALTLQQKANLTWHCYIPAGVTVLTACGATTGLHIVHIKEKKAMAAAALSAIDEVKKSAKEFEKENLGVVSTEEKQKILKERAKNNDGIAEIRDSDGVIEELYLVQDEFTGRNFFANDNRLQHAVNEVNKKINKDGECDLNTFYMWAGIEEIDRGVEVGWSGELISLQMEDEHLRGSGKPVRKFIFRPQPSKGFDDASA